MSDPERYLTRGELEHELPFEPLELGYYERDPDGDLVVSSEWSDLVQTVLGRESDRIEAWAETAYELQTATATLERPEHVPGRDLPLPKRPIDSVQSVTADGGSITEYHAEDTHLVLLEGASISAWPTDYRSIEVEWTYGFDGVPGPVEDALVRLCRNAIERVDTDGLNSESTGDGASFDYRLPEAIQAEASAAVSEHAAPSYYGGAGVI